MLTDEKIKYVREKLKEKEEVATKELLQSGIDNNDIIRLKKLGIIESSKWGHYKLGDTSKYYNEGVKLVEEKEYDKAKEMFIQSVNSNINVMEATYYLFLISVFKNNLDDAFSYFEVLYKNENSIISKSDLEFYLYMINYYNSVPSKYYQLVRNMKLDENIDSKKKYIISRNVKVNFFNKRFLDAKFLSNNGSNSNFQSVVIQSIISQVISALNTEKKQLIDLIKEKKYEDVYNYYLDIESYRDLQDYEKICLDIVEEIVGILKSGIIPNANKVITNNLSVAVGNKDYKRALEINNDFNKRKNIDNSINHINLLLVAINEVIDNIDRVRNGIKEVNKNDYGILIEYLMRGQIEEFSSELKIHLDRIGKNEYLFLIMNLVKIDSMLEDKMYSRTMMSLSLALNNNFDFNMLEYVLSFYENLALNRYDVASVFLDIIDDAKNKGYGRLNINGLREIFDTKVKARGTLFSGVTGKLEVSRKKYTFDDLNIQYTMEDLINNKVIMLDKDVDREHIREVVNDLTDIVCFEINIDGEVRVMLKYKDKSEEEGVSLSIKMK